MHRVLILGADGFIGSNLVKSLLADKLYSIRAFDLFKDGKSNNLEDVRSQIEMIQGNFLNRDDIRKSLKGVDYVFHFISLTTPGSSMNDPLIDVDTNIKGTITLLDECVHTGVKKVIFASSGGAIYGDQSKDFYTETDQANPISPYAISKLAIEKYLEYYKVHRNLDYLVLRYANPYGAGQNVVGSQGIIPIFLNLIKQNKPITIFGDGKNIRDYIYIDDLINITKYLFDKKTKYRVYNVGRGEGTSINNVVRLIENVVGTKFQINWQEARDVDVQKIVLSMSRTNAEIKLISQVSLEDGIKKTYDWMNNKSTM